MLALKYQGYGTGERDYLHFVLDSDNYTRQSGTSDLIIRYKVQCRAAAVIEISITHTSLR